MDFIENDELQHHGIPGMKWGIRRFQNKDGSLTSAGKKRKSLKDTVKEYSAAKKKKASLEKARKTRAANKKAAEEREEKIKSGKIKARNMTDAELKKRIERLNLEKTYNDAVKNARSAEAGKRFTSKYKESLIDKMADNVGADLTSQVAKAFGAKLINDLGKDAFGGNDFVYSNNKKKN